MKKSKGKWTKKRGGFLGFEMPSLPSLNPLSWFGTSEEPAKASNQPAAQPVTTSNQPAAQPVVQPVQNTVGGSRRKRKTKKSKK